MMNVVYNLNHIDKHLRPWPGKMYYPSGIVSDLLMAHCFTKLGDPTTGGGYLKMESYGSIISNYERNMGNHCCEKLVHTVLREGAKSLDIQEWQTEDDRRHGWRVCKPISP